MKRNEPANEFAGSFGISSDSGAEELAANRCSKTKDAGAEES
jgi:hypothetical protein